MSTALDHRKFILNLSTQYGQHLAAGEGFIVPSEGVQWRENIDVIRNWKMIEGARLFPYVLESAQWMLQATVQPDWTREEAAYAYRAYISLMVANLVRLHEDGMIQFAHTPEINIGVWNEALNSYVPMDDADYSYKDLIGHLDWVPDLSEEEPQ